MKSVCPINERPTTVDLTPYSKESWQVVRCRETQFVYLANPPKTDDLKEEFAWEKTYAIEHERRQREEPIVSAVSTMAKRLKTKLFPRRNRYYDLLKNQMPAVDHPLVILDVGCGGGELLADICSRMREEGRGVVIPQGIEISTALSAAATNLLKPFGGTIHSCSALDAAESLPEESVDVILMSSFLEHETRPLPLLRELRRVLTPSGILILKVPNFGCWNRTIRGKRWCGFRYPDHVNYFTPSTLGKLADAADLPISRQTFVDRIPLSDNMYAVLKKAA